MGAFASLESALVDLVPSSSRATSASPVADLGALVDLALEPLASISTTARSPSSPSSPDVSGGAGAPVADLGALVDLALEPLE